VVYADNEFLTLIWA
ncbi:unnamed protein product, partial [Allacma fusca]